MNAQVFFLPNKNRPKDLPALPAGFGDFWHAGIVYQGSVYECFSQGKHAVSPFDARRQASLLKDAAVFLDANIDPAKLESEIKSGTSCGEYVARVVGLSQSQGDVKRFSPQEVYDFLNNQQVRKSDVV